MGSVRLQASLLCITAFCLAAGPRPAVEHEAGVAKIAKAHGVTDETPGFAVAVVENGKLVLHHGYGLSNVETGEVITPQTTFELASLSKTFTGLSICILHDRGQLSFNDDVRKYIPELPKREGKPILLVNLLHHTSGLPDYIEMDAPRGTHADYVGNEDYVHQFSRKPELLAGKFEPGHQFDYCNTNYLLLAVVIERITGLSLGKFEQEEIFGPLGMMHTWINERPDSAPRKGPRVTQHAVGYEKKKKGNEWKALWAVPALVAKPMLTTGDGSVWTSVDDLVLYDAGIQAGNLVKPQTWKQAISPSNLGDKNLNRYGYGFALETNDQHRVTAFGHEGSWGGFHTAYYRYTDVDRAVIILSNRDDFKVGDAWEEVDTLFAEKKAKAGEGK